MLPTRQGRDSLRALVRLEKRATELSPCSRSAVYTQYCVGRSDSRVGRPVGRSHCSAGACMGTVRDLSHPVQSQLAAAARRPGMRDTACALQSLETRPVCLLPALTEGSPRASACRASARWCLQSGLHHVCHSDTTIRVYLWLTSYRL